MKTNQRKQNSNQSSSTTQWITQEEPYFSRQSSSRLPVLRYLNSNNEGKHLGRDESISPFEINTNDFSIPSNENENKSSKEIVRLLKPKDVFFALRQRFSGNPQELLIVFGLNSWQTITMAHYVPWENVNTHSFHPVDLVRPLLDKGTISCVTAHFQITQSTMSISDEIELVNEIREAADVMGIELIDHVSVRNDAYASFREMGFIK